MVVVVLWWSGSLRYYLPVLVVQVVMLGGVQTIVCANHNKDRQQFKSGSTKLSMNNPRQDQFSPCLLDFCRCSLIPSDSHKGNVGAKLRAQHHTIWVQRGFVALGYPKRLNQVPGFAPFETKAYEC